MVLRPSNVAEITKKENHMAEKFLTKDEMSTDEFGRSYRYYEAELSAVEEAIWFLQARGVVADPSEQD